jgi:branched-chain amino acid transport system ATP-binding protein
MPEAPALIVEGLTRRFGASVAIAGLDLAVARGESLAIIGPNGAGKSTFVNLVSGALTPTAGRITLFGQSIAHRPPEARARLGIGRTYQIPRPFGGMTVRENLLLAARHGRGERAKGAIGPACDRILERTGLTGAAESLAGALPLLRRKRLELARALALQPRLLLLDEIGAGLIERETRELIALIQEIRGEVEAIVLIEHVMSVVSACCDRTAVLNFGELVLEGPTAEVLRDPATTAVYLGATSSTDAAAVGTAPADTAAARPALLEVRGASASYDGVRALRGVDLDVGEGEVVALLGANGAGKSTLARSISGAAALDGGQIAFDGVRIDGWRSETIAAAGLSHCMEGRRIFASLTVEENLRLGARATGKAELRRAMDRLYALFPDLAERRGRPGDQMSGGQQQMLAIARALMASPRLVIFDEISLGLSPMVIDRLYAILKGLKGEGVAMLLIEQNVERGLQLADWAYVLSHGEVALSGRPSEIRDHPSLRSLYVGDG